MRWYYYLSKALLTALKLSVFVPQVLKWVGFQCGCGVVIGQSRHCIALAICQKVMVADTETRDKYG
jgi:hypothetical protein